MKSLTLGCLLGLWCASCFAQSEPALLFPFNQLEMEAAKRPKALAATEEYQTQEQELKDNTALPNNERQKQHNANYYSYLKKMEGLLNKEQRKQARTMLVENDIKGLRQKPALPRFFDQLGLSEEQAAKAKDLNLQQRIKTQTLYHSTNYSNQERAEESKYINEDFTKKFNKLLTAEQRNQLDNLRQHAAVLAKIPVPPLYQKLGLNSTQTEKLRQVLFELQAKLEALNQDPSLTPETRRQKTDMIHAEVNKNAEAILNPGQKVKIEDLLHEANYKMPPFYAQLDLTAEQQVKLKEGILWHAHEAAVLRSDTKLADEQRRQRLAQINTGLQERLAAFLTPEQITKMTALLRETQKLPPQKPPE